MIPIFQRKRWLGREGCCDRNNGTQIEDGAKWIHKIADISYFKVWTWGYYIYIYCIHIKLSQTRVPAYVYTFDKPGVDILFTSIYNGPISFSTSAPEYTCSRMDSFLCFTSGYVVVKPNLQDMGWRQPFYGLNNFIPNCPSVLFFQGKMMINRSEKSSYVFLAGLHG
jgi:hypothetical protein